MLLSNLRSRLSLLPYGALPPTISTLWYWTMLMENFCTSENRDIAHQHVNFTCSVSCPLAHLAWNKFPILPSFPSSGLQKIVQPQPFHCILQITQICQWRETQDLLCFNPIASESTVGKKGISLMGLCARQASQELRIIHYIPSYAVISITRFTSYD